LEKVCSNGALFEMLVVLDGVSWVSLAAVTCDLFPSGGTLPLTSDSEWQNTGAETSGCHRQLFHGRAQCGRQKHA
jgi:hypothetical protein